MCPVRFARPVPQGKPPENALRQKAKPRCCRWQAGIRSSAVRTAGSLARQQRLVRLLDEPREFLCPTDCAGEPIYSASPGGDAGTAARNRRIGAA
jgi:hypothetical protein